MSPGRPAGRSGMAFVTAHMSISLDGFVAGPGQSQDEPIGRGGMALHQWHFDPVHEIDQPFVDRLLGERGAYIMGRNMFGPVRGEWGDSDWSGWWGPEPPYHAPVFVLTHHPHEPIEMEGGTTFHFVEGFDAALERATEVAGELPIDIAGGAGAVRQAIQSGALDELVLDVVPVLLGGGERIFDGVDPQELQQVESVAGPDVTHLVHRFGR